MLLADQAETEATLECLYAARRQRHPVGDDIDHARYRLEDIGGLIAMARQAIRVLDSGKCIESVEPGATWIIKLGGADSQRCHVGRGDRLLKQHEYDELAHERFRERAREARRAAVTTARINYGPSIARLFERAWTVPIPVEHTCETCRNQIVTGEPMIQLARGRALAGFETPTYVDERGTDRVWHAECLSIEDPFEYLCANCTKSVKGMTVWYAVRGRCPGRGFRRPEDRPRLLYAAHDGECHRTAWSRVARRSAE